MEVISQYTYQFVMMHINNLQIPMIRINGECYITQDKLSRLLGVTSKTLRNTYRARRDEFDGVRAHNMGAIEFIKENRRLLGVSYVRGDMHLWSEKDMLIFTMLLRGPRGKEIRSEIVQMIRDNARYDTVPKHVYDKTREEIDDLIREISYLRGEVDTNKQRLESLSRKSLTK